MDLGNLISMAFIGSCLKKAELAQISLGTAAWLIKKSTYKAEFLYSDAYCWPVHAFHLERILRRGRRSLRELLHSHRPACRSHQHAVPTVALSLDPQPYSWYQICPRTERDRPCLPSWHEHRCVHLLLVNGWGVPCKRQKANVHNRYKLWFSQSD